MDFFESPVCTGHSVFRRKTQSKHSQTMFLGTFSDNFESFEVFAFFKVFSKPRPSKVHWRLFFETKLPQNRFRTCLDNIRDSFGHFRNIEIFHFFQSFPYSTLQGAMCKIFTEKITSKHVQNMFDCFWERFLGILKKWKFSSFLEFFQVSTLQGALGNFFRKNHLKTSSKLVWTLLGKFLDTFEFSNFFDFFIEFFQVSTLKGALVNLFLPKKLAQSMFKTCLNFLGNVFGHFEKKWKFFLFSDVFPCFDPPGCTGQYFFPEKNLKTSSTLVWKLLRTFLDTFRNSIFSIFFRISASFDLQGALVKKSSKKISSKQIWTLLEMFFGILKKWDFFPFFWISFDFSTLQDALGEIFHRKKYLEACWKHVWTLLGTYLGILKKWKFSSFLKFFPVWNFQGAQGDFFRENYLKISSKLVWTLLRTFWTLLRNHFFFRFFFEFLQNSISRLHWARKLRKKLPQASLDTFGKVFWDFGTLKAFRFLWIFLECPVCTGHSVFRRKTQS